MRLASLKMRATGAMKLLAAALFAVGGFAGSNSSSSSTAYLADGYRELRSLSGIMQS